MPRTVSHDPGNFVLNWKYYHFLTLSDVWRHNLLLVLQSHQSFAGSGLPDAETFRSKDFAVTYQQRLIAKQWQASLPKIGFFI